MRGMDVVIRPALAHDFDEMITLSSKTHLSDMYKTLIPADEYERFSKTYEPGAERSARGIGTLSSRHSSRDWHMAVAEYDGEVVGFTVALHEGNMLKLRGLFVDPDFQGQGIGSALFDHSMTWRRGAEPVRLVVLKENRHAQRLYQSRGFTLVGRVESLFFGAEQVMMERIN